MPAFLHSSWKMASKAGVHFLICHYLPVPRASKKQGHIFTQFAGGKYGLLANTTLASLASLMISTPRHSYALAKLAEHVLTGHFAYILGLLIAIKGNTSFDCHFPSPLIHHHGKLKQERLLAGAAAHEEALDRTGYRQIDAPLVVMGGPPVLGQQALPYAQGVLPGVRPPDFLMRAVTKSP